MALFGLINEKDIGKGSVEEAHRAVNDAITRIDPLLTKIFMMGRALIHSAISRFKCRFQFEFEILPDPGPNPPPKDGDTYKY